MRKYYVVLNDNTRIVEAEWYEVDQGHLSFSKKVEQEIIVFLTLAPGNWRSVEMVE